jgi:hypothetical protein
MHNSADITQGVPLYVKPASVGGHELVTTRNSCCVRVGGFQVMSDSVYLQRLCVCMSLWASVLQVILEGG